MGVLSRSTSVLAFCLLTASIISAQSAAETAADLRAQLEQVKSQQVELEDRVKSLDEQLKPENIQNSLAGYGSLHPEELREQRKRQLEREKAGVVAQLEKLSISRSRLENAVMTADAAAYHQSAQPNYDSPKPVRHSRRVRRVKKRKVKRKPVSFIPMAPSHSHPVLTG
jgi:cell division protein FtsB